MRELLLDQAIQGKLVPQLDSEPTVEQIGAAPKEVPFEIPAKWKWVNFDNLLKIISGTSYSKNDIVDSSNDTAVRIMRGGNLRKGIVSTLNDDVFVNSGLHDLNKEVQNTDIVVVASTGSQTVIGRAAVYSGYESIQIGAFLRILRPKNKDFFPYLKYIFFSNYYINHIRASAKGSNIKNLKQQYFSELYIPLPPLEEQKRIVAKLEKAFYEIERAEQAYNELQELKDKLKSKILQKAMEGKLVPQLNSEPAVEQIGAAPKEVPFEIPAKWKWQKLDNALSFENGDRGSNYPAKSKLTHDSSSGHPFVSAGNLSNFKIDSNNLLYLSKEQLSKLRSGHIKNGDCLFCIRGSLGKFGFANQDGGAIASSLVILRINDKNILKRSFLFYILQAPFFYKSMQNRKNGTAQPNLGAKELKEILIPLPPLEEQKRIVAKIEALFEQIDRMQG